MTLPHDKNFFYVPIAALQDTRLSWAARGMLVYIFSMPDDWEFSVPDLVALSKMDSEGIRVLQAELEAVGYLRQERMLDQKTGSVRWVINIYEDPAMPSMGLPDDDSGTRAG